MRWWSSRTCIGARAKAATSVLGAVSQITGPLISSTLTTVVVFAPLGLLSGVPGQFFQALSLSLSVAVLISLALAVSVVALMARWAAARHRPAGEWHGRLEQTYERMLGVMVRRPLIAVATGVLLLALTVVLFSRVGTGFFPPADEGGFVLDYLTPEGSALATPIARCALIERVVAETPEVAAYSRRTGSELGLFATAQNSGDILVRLKPRNQRSRSSEEIISDLRERVHEAVPLVEIEFVQLLQDMLGDLEGSAEPIEVKIFGDDPERLAAVGGTRRGSARAESTASSTSSARNAAIPKSRGRSTRSRPRATDSVRSRCRSNWPATGWDN